MEFSYIFRACDFLIIMTILYSHGKKCFLQIFWRTSFLFLERLMPLFWTSGEICPGFQFLDGFPACILLCPYAMDSSGVTPADILMANCSTYVCMYTYMKIGGT